MSRFLDFLNTADLNTLTQISGVNRQLAGNLIAARPFDAEEDALKVKGMGKATLARIQSFAEAQETAPESSAMVPVQEEAMPAVIEKNQPTQEEAPKKESFLVRLGRAIRSFFVALLKLIMLAILFVSIGAMFYYGLPYIQRTFIAPVEQNTAQIQTMEAEIETLQTQLDEMNSRVSALEGSVEAHTTSIEKLEEMQTSLEAQLSENQDAVLLELKQEIMFTRALDVLARARLYLAQSNFGLAKADVQTARDLLAELNAEKKDEVLTKAIERIDLALGNLPDFPVVASGDLEIAWQILVSGNAPASTATPTLVPTEPATSTPTAADTAATPTLVPSATATP
ncbi:MAG: helix-hairpin-helix domain-containing protein [Anaerolineales bacterium]